MNKRSTLQKIKTKKRNEHSRAEEHNKLSELKILRNRPDQMEDRISEIEGRNLKMIHVEEERELRGEKNKELYENYEAPLQRPMPIPEREERKGNRLFRQIIDENFRSVCKDLGLGNQEPKRIPNYFNAQRTTPRHAI